MRFIAYDDLVAKFDGLHAVGRGDLDDDVVGRGLLEHDLLPP